LNVETGQPKPKIKMGQPRPTVMMGQTGPKLETGCSRPKVDICRLVWRMRQASLDRRLRLVYQVEDRNGLTWPKGWDRPTQVDGRDGSGLANGQDGLARPNVKPIEIGW